MILPALALTTALSTPQGQQAASDVLSGIGKTFSGIFGGGNKNENASKPADGSLTAKLANGTEVSGNGEKGINAVKELVGSRQSQPGRSSIPTSPTTGLSNPLTLQVSAPRATGTPGTTNPGTTATPINNSNNNRPIQITFA